MPFWRYVKSKQQDTVGVSPLKVDGQLHSGATYKADNMDKQLFLHLSSHQPTTYLNYPAPNTPHFTP